MTKDHNDEVEPVAPTDLQTVLFALRFYEGHRMAIDFPGDELESELTDNGRIGTPFSVDIDALCKRLQHSALTPAEVHITMDGGLIDRVDFVSGAAKVTVWDYDIEGTAEPLERDRNGKEYIAFVYESDEGIDTSDIPVVGPEFFANAKLVLPELAEGARIFSIHGENDEGDHGPRQTGPDALGEVWRKESNTDGYAYHVTFEPSQVWVVLYAHEIADPKQYRVVTDRHEIAARDAGWTSSEGGVIFYFRKDSTATQVYTSWAECCAGQDIEVAE